MEYGAHRKGQSEASRDSLRNRSPRIKPHKLLGYQALRLRPQQSIITDE